MNINWCWFFRRFFQNRYVYDFNPPVMKWLLSRGKLMNPFLPFNIHHICCLTASEKSVILQFPAFGHSVIRGLVTNRLMVRREFYDLGAWITFVPHRRVADNSNLEVTTAPFRYCQLFTCFFGRNSAVYCWFLLNHPFIMGR